MTRHVPNSDKGMRSVMTHAMPMTFLPQFYRMDLRLGQK
jgi:hypothetical protein